jgi:SOS-response transcriptional repressor LexA
MINGATVTPQRVKVFNFILTYKCQNDGNSPTFREIMDACRISSTSMVVYYLKQLEKMGMIRRPEPVNGNRSSARIEIVGGSWKFIGSKA